MNKAESQPMIPEDYLYTTVEQRKRWRTQSWHGHEASIQLLLADIDTLRERLKVAENASFAVDAAKGDAK